uniref:Uncharacterized protein n=1 Tax=Romanomermis culicivorax TaxID=13658 RepID=A0A915I9S4_ROMCU
PLPFDNHWVEAPYCATVGYAAAPWLLYASW